MNTRVRFQSWILCRYISLLLSTVAARLIRLRAYCDKWNLSIPGTLQHALLQCHNNPGAGLITLEYAYPSCQSTCFVKRRHSMCSRAEEPTCVQQMCNMSGEQGVLILSPLSDIWTASFSLQFINCITKSPIC